MVLPPQVRVLVRDWLSGNNVVLQGRDGHVLVDSGYSSHAPLTLALVARVLQGAPLARLVNTHGHSDHVGGNAAIKDVYGCPIAFPAAEADLVERWDTAALLYDYADQDAPRFAVDERLHAGTTHVWGDLEWRLLSAPGHDMGALVFYNPEHRILISGDALWRDGFGILFAEVMGQGDALGEARRTLEAIGRLAVDAVIPGHGAPFAEFDDALERAFARIRAFEDDGARMARNAIRACITFKLLEVRSMALAELPRHLDETPLYRTANARYLGLDADALAAWLVKELERAGVARSEDGALVVL